MEIGVGERGKGKVISRGEAGARIVYLKGVPENPIRRNTFHNQRGPFWSFGNVEGPLPNLVIVVIVLICIINFIIIIKQVYWTKIVWKKSYYILMW